MPGPIKEELKDEGILSVNPQEEPFFSGAKNIYTENRHIWRKLDMHLLPWVALLYLLSFL
jgi:hypothetical protein